ncbi:hypothetical protein [Caballeronia concitans]|nr:hypothetical protein [Caballeronia concitans]
MPKAIEALSAIRHDGCKHRSTNRFLFNTTKGTHMTEQTDRSTPPKQTDSDPTAADRRLSDEQKQNAANEPAPPDADKGPPLPDPNAVGEDG